MKKTKTQKGITLIALIITIVVLLILAAVAIKAVQGDGIIAKAKEAQTKYEDAQAAEEERLLEYEYQIASSQGNFTGSYTEYALNKKYPGVKIGDYVNYDSGVESYDDTNGWRVLGIENGQLLLMSSSSSSDLVVSLSGPDEYLTGISRLNEDCEKYGKGIGATSARSITVEDVNKITGYNPRTTGDGVNFGKGRIDEYESKVTFTLTSEGKVKYSNEANSLTRITDSTIFIMPDGTTLGTVDSVDGKQRKSIDIINTRYAYYPDTLTESKTGSTKGIEKTSPAYNMLFNCGSYVLASNCVQCFEDSWEDEYYCGVVWDFFMVGNKGMVASTGYNVYTSDENFMGSDFNFRPVVLLSSGVELNGKDANGVWQMK